MRRTVPRPLEDAERWRKRAELFRRKAKEAEGVLTAQALLGLAEAWDRWASRAERGLRPGRREL